VQIDRKVEKFFVKNIEIFLKKHLKFPDKCVRILKHDCGCDETGGGHSAEFSRRIWEISVEQVRPKSRAQVRGKAKNRPFLELRGVPRKPLK